MMDNDMDYFLRKASHINVCATNRDTQGYWDMFFEAKNSGFLIQISEEPPGYRTTPKGDEMLAAGGFAIWKKRQEQVSPVASIHYGNNYTGNFVNTDLSFNQGSINGSRKKFKSEVNFGEKEELAKKNGGQVLKKIISWFRWILSLC